MLLSSSLVLSLRCAVSLKSLAIQAKCVPISQKIEKVILFCRNLGYDGQGGIEASAKGAGSDFLKKGLCGTAGTPCFCALGIVVSLGSRGRKKLRKTAAKSLKSFTRVTSRAGGSHAICMPSS